MVRLLEHLRAQGASVSRGVVVHGHERVDDARVELDA
jgi:hypothetical protein